MIIDIQEVIDYCKCPMYYKFKHKDVQYKNKVITTLEKYEQDLHKVVYSFFSLIQNHEPATLRSLKSSWGSLFINNKTTQGIICTDSPSWRDTHNERRKRGTNAVINFFEIYKDNPGFPIAINQKYEVPIGKSITLTGTWELIREVQLKGEKLIEIVDFKVDDKLHNKISIEKDLCLTSASYAFRQISGAKEDILTYYGLEKKKMQTTTRTEEDYKMLKHTVTCVAKAIHNKLYYACPDDKCFTCAYKSICSSNLNYKTMSGGEQDDGV